MKNLNYSDDDLANNKMIDDEIIVTRKVIEIIIYFRGMLYMMIV